MVRKLQLSGIIIFILSIVGLQAQNWEYVGKFEGTEALLFKGGHNYQSMKISPSGTPYVAFQDAANNNKATVLSFDGSNWGAVGNVGISAGGAEYLSLAISSSGVIYLAYSDALNISKTTVLRFDGINWVPLGNAGVSAGPAYQQSLAISSAGIPYVAYNDQSFIGNNGTTVISFDGNNWGTVGGVGGVDINSQFGDGQTLAITPSGVPYVAYRDYLHGYKVTVLSFNGSNWGVAGNVGISSGEAYFLSLAVSPSGIPHIAYQDQGAGPTSVLRFNGNNWEPVGGFLGISNGAPDYQGLSFSRSGVPYVCARDGYSRTYVISFNGTNWGTVGGTEISGDSQYRSISISQDGVPYVAYRDNLNGNITTVISFNGINWGQLGKIGNSAGNAENQSFTFSSSGVPYVAYTDGVIGGKMTVLSFDGINWGNVGIAGISAGETYSNSIAISHSGVPYVAYSDLANDNKTTVLSFDGTNWGPVGGQAGISAGPAFSQSLTFSPSGTLYVAYRDDYNYKRTTVLSFNGTNWGTVGTAGISLSGQANYQRLDFNPSGTPYLVFSDYDNYYRTTVLSFDGSNWGYVGNGISATNAYNQSLTISPTGVPYVAYTDNFSGLTSVLSFDGTNWTSLDAKISVNQAFFPSLAVNNSGIPYVAYCDWNNEHKTSVLSFNGINWVGLAGIVNISAAGSDNPNLRINPITGQPWVAYRGLGGALFVQQFAPCKPPVIKSQPSSQFLCSNGSFPELNLSVTGVGLHYLWNTGETTPSILSSSTGSYFVTITGACGTITSNEIIVSSGENTTVVSSPLVSQTICGGNLVTLNVSALGSNLSYRWNSGETSTSIIKSITGLYIVTVTGACGTLISDPDSLLVNEITSIISQPVSQTICGGNLATFSISVTGSNLSYLWNTGATTTGITTSLAGTYLLTINGACESIISNTATLNTSSIVSIIVQPVSQTVCDGNTTTFEAQGNLSGLYYLWNTGETSASITKSIAGIYLVTVSGTCGKVVSDTANLITNACSVTGIQSLIEQTQTISIFPNPTKGSWNLQSGDWALGNTMQVYNSLGVIVYTQRITSANTTLDTDLLNGIYLVKVGNFLKKLLVE